MISGIAAILLFARSQASFDLNHPFVLDEVVVMSQKMKIEFEDRTLKMDSKTQHKCVFINTEGVQSIETEILEGFMDQGSEKEELKGETNSYFRNSYGESFDFEEVKATLKDQPFQFMQDEVMSNHKRRSVVTGEAWNAETANTRYRVTVGRVAEINGVKCIKVTREGVFQKGMVGEYTSEGWYRLNGLLQSMVVKAKNVAPTGYEMLNFELTLSLVSQNVPKYSIAGTFR